MCAIFAASEAAVQLQNILRWDEPDEDPKSERPKGNAKLESREVLAEIDVPSVQLPMVPKSDLQGLFHDNLHDGGAEIQAMRASITATEVLKRRANLERLRSCTPFADEPTMVALRELDAFLEAHGAKSFPLPGFPALLAFPKTPSFKRPGVCLHWWCDHPQSTTIVLYFVVYAKPIFNRLLPESLTIALADGGTTCTCTSPSPSPSGRLLRSAVAHSVAGRIKPAGN
jgi:hypothetical protein